MKDSKKILKNLLKNMGKDSEPKVKVMVTIKKSQKKKLLEKYGTVESFERAIDELYDEVMKKQL